MEGTGLVLAGGGGKGVYQVGMIKSLAAAGLLDDVVAVSGTSIGGVNAVLFAEGLLEGKLAFDKSISENVINNEAAPHIDEKIRTAAGIEHTVKQMEDVWNEIDFSVFFDFDAVDQFDHYIAVGISQQHLIGIVTFARRVFQNHIGDVFINFITCAMFFQIVA